MVRRPFSVPVCPICQDVICREPHDPEAQRLWAELQAKLLKIGGERVIWRSDHYLPDLLVRGQLFAEPMTMHRGQRSACHENAAKLWGKDVTGTQVCVGYGLSDDGVWRQHSWARQQKTIVETTLKRTHYFGMALGDEEALRFWFDNVASHYPLHGKAQQKLLKRYPGVLAIIKQLAASEGDRVDPKGPPA